MSSIESSIITLPFEEAASRNLCTKILLALIVNEKLTVPNVHKCIASPRRSSVVWVESCAILLDGRSPQPYLPRVTETGVGQCSWYFVHLHCSFCTFVIRRICDRPFQGGHKAQKKLSIKSLLLSFHFRVLSARIAYREISGSCLLGRSMTWIRSRLANDCSKTVAQLVR